MSYDRPDIVRVIGGVLMSRTDDVLAAIDHAVHDFEISDDAMRWQPEPARRQTTIPPVGLRIELLTAGEAEGVWDLPFSEPPAFGSGVWAQTPPVPATEFILFCAPGERDQVAASIDADDLDVDVRVVESPAVRPGNRMVARNPGHGITPVYEVRNPR